MASQTGDDRIRGLLEDLGGGRWRARRDARDELEALGPAAVPGLVAVLKDPNDQLRWEALKLLAERLDASLAPAFVEAMATDRNEGNRWVAANALTALGYPALAPLLSALVEHSDRVFLRDGAHHVLKALSRQGLLQLVQPVLTALEGLEPALTVPLAAHKVLDQMGS